MYEDRTPEAIKAEILGAIRSDLQTREGSFTDDMSGPLAVQLYKMYIALNRVFGMVFVDETSGIYLDMTANEIGIDPRKEGEKACVTLKITGEPGIFIDAGKQFLTKDRLVYLLDEDTVIGEDGVALATAAAEKVGVRYNVEADEIHFQLETQAGISAVTNPESAQGGADSESDESLFTRIDAARKKPITSGNIYHYEKWALEAAGIGAVRVFPLWAGPGTVKVLVVDDHRQPVDSLTVERCAQHIESVRPVGADVTVESAQGVTISVSAQVRLKEGVDPEEVQRKFQTYLKEYLSALAFRDNTVRYNRIGALLMGTSGVTDYRELQINGAAESVALTDLQVPIPGEVVFTWI